MKQNVPRWSSLVAVVGLLSIQSASAQLFQGLVGYWDFDEGAGSTAHDRSGTGNDATLVANATWSGAGRFGGALQLQGGSDAAQVATPMSLPVGGSPRTIAGWMFVTDENRWWAGGDARYQALVGYGSPLTTGAPFALERGADWCYGKVVQLDWAINQAGNTPNGIPLNVWTHLALTFDGSRLTLYLNGVEDGFVDNRWLGNSLDATGLLLGNMPPNDGWHAGVVGLIDDVGIWNRALTPTEIGSIAATPVAVPEPASTACLILLSGVLTAGVLRRRAS